MICRIWHGWTTYANADAYQSLLLSEIFPGIQNRHIAGYRSIQLLRHDHADEVEFVTVMWFDSLDAIRAFIMDPVVKTQILPKISGSRPFHAQEILDTAC